MLVGQDALVAVLMAAAAAVPQRLPLAALLAVITPEAMARMAQYVLSGVSGVLAVRHHSPLQT